MVRRPQAFLMDEPLTNLDAKLRTVMRAELKHLHGELGATTLYVTHDQVEAMTMGDRIAVLRAGVLPAGRHAGRIYLRPANTFVGRLRGQPPHEPAARPGRTTAASGHADGIALHLDGDAGLCRCAEGRPLSPWRPAPEVVLGVRAENIAIVPATKPDALPTTVYAVEPLGDRYIYDLQLGGCVIKMKASPDARPRRRATGLGQLRPRPPAPV